MFSKSLLDDFGGDDDIQLELDNIPQKHYIDPVIHRFQEAFLDSAHPWKQQKYFLALSNLALGLEQDMEILNNSIEASLEVLKYTENSLDGFEIINDGVQDSKFFLDKLVSDLLKKIYKLQPVVSCDYRRIYHSFIDELRYILNNEEFNKQLALKKQGCVYNTSIDIVLNLCYKRFKHLNINLFSYHVLSNVINQGLKHIRIDSSKGVESVSLKYQFEAIACASSYDLGAPRLHIQASNLQGAIDLGFDPHRNTNIPHLFYNIPGSIFELQRPWLQVLRFATPTRDGMVIEEFKAFLEALRFKGEKHLYINLQAWNPDSHNMQKSIAGVAKNYFGEVVQRVASLAVSAFYADNIRSKNIERLCEEFPDTFYFAAFAQDTPFYHQKVIFAGENEAGVIVQQFLDLFLDQIINSNEKYGFHMPKVLKDTSYFKNDLQRLIKDICFDFYPEKERLTVYERKDFIEIFYVFLEIYLIKTLKVYSLNITCKDAIDRAGKSNALLFEALTLALNDQDSELLKAKLVVTHGPAFFAKKQPIVHGRRERLLSAMERLVATDMKEKMKLRLQAMGLKINECQERVSIQFLQDQCVWQKS
jgi:hypothetical protein